MAFRDIRKSRKVLRGEEIFLLIIALSLLAGLFVLNLHLARILPGRELLFLRWSAARAFWVEKTEPYGAEVAQRVQLIAYNGRLAYSDEFPFALSDPFYIILLYTPLALLGEVVSLFSSSLAPYFDFNFARAFWLFLSELALIGIVLYSVRLSEWEPPRWWFPALFGFGLFGYFSLNALAVGTPSIFLTFLYLSILLALRAGYDELAGGLLSLATYQWEVGGLFFLFVLILIFSHRRWGVLIGLAMAMFVLLAASFLANPGWGLPYIRGVLSNWYRTPFLNLASILDVWFPAIPFNLGAVISLAFGVLVFFEWIGAVNSSFQRIFWVASLSLAVTPLVGFAIFPSNYVALIPAFILIISLVWERWSRNRNLTTLFVFVVASLVPFGLYSQTSVVYNRLYTDLLSVLPPLGTIIGLYWMRWWVVRSPRTWADQIGGRS
ncbi:MAG: DUF2029 domain-containing protein [Chloroflexi bacterium]|nr:DUF2029 domain-containing protein [Chloroflexota bacterium]